MVYLTKPVRAACPYCRRRGLPRHAETGTFWPHTLPRPMRPGRRRVKVRCPAREP